MIYILLAYVHDPLSHHKAKKEMLSGLPKANTVSRPIQILSEG